MLKGKARTPFSTSFSDNPPPRGAFHAGAEAMGLGALPFFWLIGSFCHGFYVEELYT
jgi:hypothetical protein